MIRLLSRGRCSDLLLSVSGLHGDDMKEGNIDYLIPMQGNATSVQCARRALVKIAILRSLPGLM